ncbi:CxC2 domain-containing protein [Favolaschia claudopus]|uniref:CxC2 domain-containing protein n=1 Tax=Favolaschia claudopus TaxID=2862362 RepID=A0AAW0A028_9AGAR
MDRKRKRVVYKHTSAEQGTSVANASKRRVRVEHHPAPPRSPEKQSTHDIFDQLMGFDDDQPPPVLSEGPAALKIKVKAKRYENSDHPVKTWIPMRDDYKDGLLQLKGRGPWWCKGCALCGHSDPTWRCDDCFGNRLLCRGCVIQQHRDQPLHLLQEWDNGYFQRRTSQDLDLRFQIGHPFGEDCPFNYSGTSRPFVVLDNNGIHSLNIDFCRCSGAASEVAQLLNVGWFPATHQDPSTAATLSLLRRFHKLNLQARLPGYDFYNSLVLLTNAAGLGKVPDRLQQFMNMVREYRHLQMCIRAGRGHDLGGIAGTQPGELAMPCRACPHPGINLPDGWENAPPEVAWIYRQFVSEDANFKMKGRAQSTRENDPTLGPGWAYMVASDSYLKFLAEHIDEDEISHCVSFAALWSANNKRSKGLRATGIGSVSCSRHEMFRPLGTGDLQKGEKYSNMDYLWFSSLIGITLLTIVASYDIACQWCRNFWTRAKHMPDDLQLPDWVQVIFKVPKFHLPPHVKKCHGPFSFNFTKGVGRTDGEGVERNWSWLNLAARSISVMGPGSREDTIDDLCAFFNWKKTVDLGNSLLRKMVLAIPQAMIHSRAFHSFTNGLREGHEGDLAKWEKMVRDWEMDQENPSPYDYTEVEAKTMTEVLARIAAEEHAAVARDGASALTVKPGPFLIEGIEIQQTQATLQLEVKRPNRTTIQATTLQRSRTVLLAKVKVLHDEQAKYMPGLKTWLSQQTPALPTGNNAQPETIPIYLPSSLPPDARAVVCAPSLVQQEDALRYAQAQEALHSLRSNLRTRTFAHQFKRRHVANSQGAYTKSRELLDGIERRIGSASSRYRAAREALLHLRGSGAWEEELQELKKEDIRGMNERLLNEQEKEENRKARLLAGLPEDATGNDLDEYGQPVELTTLFNLETGEGRRQLSWIWYSGGVRASDVNGDGSLHEDIRVEWTKARARADRWREELILLDEEMRRVLEFCLWKARWWEERSESRASEVTAELQEGLRAYALAQAARERAWESAWRGKWAAVRDRSKTVMRDQLVDVSELVPLEVELDEEEEMELDNADDDDE